VQERQDIEGTGFTAPMATPMLRKTNTLSSLKLIN